jgi:hypothetical protein
MNGNETPLATYAATSAQSGHPQGLAATCGGLDFIGFPGGLSNVFVPFQ